MTDSPTDFLDAPGEMARLIREFPWAQTELGSIENWPVDLKVTVGILVNSRFPMVLWWGPDSIEFYNDAYALTFGDTLLFGLLGQPARNRRKETWTVLGPMIGSVMSGNGTLYSEDQLVPIMRDNRLEDTYWTYSIAPVSGDGFIAGALAVITDVTQQHFDIERSRKLSEGLLQLFKAGPDFVAILRGPQHVYQFVNDHYRALMGDRDFIGRPVFEVVPEVANQGFPELLDRVYRTGKTFTSDAIPMRYHPAPGAPLTDVMLKLTYQAIVGPDGKIFGVYVEGHPLMDKRQSPADERTEAEMLDAQLSERETEVLRWTAAGKTAAEIATILDISGRTVEFHINSAARKLDTVNRIQTVVEAMKKKLI
ncbi:MAG: LuxR C-terminal-related transcriptional regulator [Devosia sp.]